MNPLRSACGLRRARARPRRTLRVAGGSGTGHEASSAPTKGSPSPPPRALPPSPHPLLWRLLKRRRMERVPALAGGAARRRVRLAASEPRLLSLVSHASPPDRGDPSAGRPETRGAGHGAAGARRGLAGAAPGLLAAAAAAGLRLPAALQLVRPRAAGLGERGPPQPPGAAGPPHHPPPTAPPCDETAGRPELMELMDPQGRAPPPACAPPPIPDTPINPSSTRGAGSVWGGWTPPKPPSGTRSPRPACRWVPPPWGCGGGEWGGCSSACPTAGFIPAPAPRARPAPALPRATGKRPEQSVPEGPTLAGAAAEVAADGTRGPAALGPPAS
ncbi:uncharacterized protein LOC142364921 [Opisthocomus hoazin]|uniref:uncharacterized protein LOC142364921 n=1 Tax=Opisthocomus hoazin TaxID=30419 RepID=UPI003F539EDC